MDVQIEPEPAPAEREAIDAALERLLEDRLAPPGAAAYASPWRLAGLRENVWTAASDGSPSEARAITLKA